MGHFSLAAKPTDRERSWRQSTLASLQAAILATFDCLLLAHPELNRPNYRVRMTRRGITARSILRQLDRLTDTLTRYQVETDRCCSPLISITPSLTPARISVPAWWSAQEADVVFEFLSAMAQAVWDAHQPGFLDVPIDGGEPERCAEGHISPERDEMPF